MLKILYFFVFCTYIYLKKNNIPTGPLGPDGPCFPRLPIPLGPGGPDNPAVNSDKRSKQRKKVNKKISNLLFYEVKRVTNRACYFLLTQRKKRKAENPFRGYE